MASFDDRPEIIRMLRDAHRAAGDIFPYPFSTEHAVDVATRHLVDDDCLALVVPGGMLLASCAPHPFAPVKYAFETVWWIDPDFRGGTLAVRMLRDYENWARGKGCAFITMASLVHSPVNYEKFGYRETETHFIKCL